jgi:hypothetical protein
MSECNTAKDLAKLAQAFFANVERRDDCEYGSIGIDCKRPFGNSDVEGDILTIIGAKMEGDDGQGPCFSSVQRKYAANLYNSLPVYLTDTYLIDTEIRKEFAHKINKSVAREKQRWLK